MLIRTRTLGREDPILAECQICGRKRKTWARRPAAHCAACRRTRCEVKRRPRTPPPGFVYAELF